MEDAMPTLRRPPPTSEELCRHMRVRAKGEVRCELTQPVRGQGGGLARLAG